MKAFKLWVIAQNIVWSQNRAMEKINRTFKNEHEETVYELGMQWQAILYDLNLESWQWNRLPDEPRL